MILNWFYQNSWVLPFLSSSEDEKISACVFSVSDIEEENERLARIERQTKAIVDSVQATVKEVSKKKKKKKKKKKALEKSWCIVLGVL